MKRCPVCGCKRFIVSAHVVQEWIVDENGMFESVLNDCICVTHDPRDDDLWQCYDCGFDAAGKEFDCEDEPIE